MKTPTLRLRYGFCAGILFLGALLTPTASTSAQASGNTRELSGLKEEQALLLRQLQRLRNTMEILVQSLEAEGRERTAVLLRDAIEELDRRTNKTEQAHPLTLEERMDRVHEFLDNRQLVQSIQQQEELVVRIEALLSILLDRKNLESLEEKIDELRELREAVQELAGRESTLIEETRELREQASNDTQRELEKQLAEMIEKQREALRAGEDLGRKSGTLELEQLEQQLVRLLKDQNTDAAMLQAWSPEQAAELLAAKQELQRALLASERAERLASATRDLEEASRALRALDDPNQDPSGEPTPSGENGKGELEPLRERLAESLSRAERASERSQDPSVEATVEALRRAARALEEARSGEADLNDLAERIEEEELAMLEAAEHERSEAEAARDATRAELKQLLDEDTVAGQAARDIDQHLAQASQAEREGDARQARHSTQRAAEALERARGDLEMLGEALAQSQQDQAKRAQRLERGLSTMPQAQTEDGKRAAEALEEAAENMRSASESARTDQPETAAAAAEAAARALERAQESLAGSRASAHNSQTQAAQELAEAQGAAAEQLAELKSEVPNGSMSPEAQRQVEAALDAAQSSMQEAQQALEQGRSASAAGSQREALQELQRAEKAASEGVTPQSPEDARRAEELAKEQEKIKKDILDLARRMQERDNPRPTPNMQKAQDAADEAAEELRAGDPAGAEEKEQEVVQELLQMQKELEKEEDEYQSLRDEEKLFAIAEELQGMVEIHAEQIAELVELDSQRSGTGAPSRSQRLRLRRIARAEESLGNRATEMATAIEEEGALVSAQLLNDIATDLDRISTALTDRGDYETGRRTQSLQRDVKESLVWLLDALHAEQNRQKEQEQKQEQKQDQEQEETEDSLIPDTAELKLLRRMEIRLQNSVNELLRLYPELSDPDSVDRRVLRDIERLALRHENITEQFRFMRRRIGLPDPVTE